MEKYIDVIEMLENIIVNKLDVIEDIEVIEDIHVLIDKLENK